MVVSFGLSNEIKAVRATTHHKRSNELPLGAFVAFVVEIFYSMYLRATTRLCHCR